MDQDRQTQHILKLPDILDLPAANRLHAEILKLKGKDVAVDASEVSRIGAQCLQVLLSAAASWRKSGAAFSVNQSSETYARTVQLLGVTDESVIPMEIV